MAIKRKPLAERFWAKVDRRGPDDCWNWTAMTHPDGHGRIGEGGHYGRMLYAHRVSYELHIGPIPPGLVVMHKCDNPRCVNPAHLQLGTDADNHRDCWNKGRSPFKPSMPGASHPLAKITPAIAAEVLRLVKALDA